MRRMITEKDADKLRFLNEYDGNVALANDADIKIALDGVTMNLVADDEIKLWCNTIQYYNPDDDHCCFSVAPDSIYMELPTQDPHNKGYLWNDNGIVKISLG